MLISEKAKVLAQGVEVNLSPEPALVQGSNLRKAPVPESTSVVDSFLAGQMQSAPVQLAQWGYEKLTQPSAGYAPDEVDLTQDAEVMDMVNQLPEEQKYKVLGAISKEQAVHIGTNLLETQELQRIQFANGTMVGMGSEVLSWLDPISIMTGNAYLNGATKIPKLLRLGKGLERLKGAAALGTYSAGEQYIRDIQNEGADSNDLLYAGLVGMGAGAAFGKYIFKEGDAIDAIGKHATDNQKVATDEIITQMDDDLVKAGLTDPVAKPSTEFTVIPEQVVDDAVDAMPMSTLDRTEQVAQHMNDTVKSGGVVKIAKGVISKLTKKNPFMTDGFRLLTSKSDTAKVLASHVGELAIGGRGELTTTSAMYKAVRESQYLGVIPQYKTLKQEFLASKGITRRNPTKYYGKAGSEFDREVMLEMNRRFSGQSIDNLNEVVKRAADKLDEINKRVLHDMQTAGWEGSHKIQWKPGYVPLLWSGKAMQELVGAGRKASVNALVVKAYQSVGFNKKVATRLAKAVITRKLSGAEGNAFDPSMFAEALQKGNLEMILRDAGLHEDDIKGVMKLTSKEKNDGFMKRTNIDISTTHDGISMTDLIHTDVENIMSRYYQEAAGKYGLAMKNIKSQADIDTLIGLVKREVSEAGGDTVKTGEAVEALFQHQLAKPIHNGVGKNTRRALDWSMVTKLGGIAFAQLAEMANVTAAHGLFNTLKSVPEAGKLYKQLLKAVKTGNFDHIDRAYMGEMQVFGGQMFDEHLLYRPSVHLDESIQASGWGAMYDHVMAISSDAMGHLSGMYAVKGIEQTMVMMHQANKVAKVLSKNLSRKSLSRLTDLGWDGKVAERLAKELKKHATFKNGTLDRLNLENWAEQARTEFTQGMQRHVGQIIQRKFVGEDTYWMHSSMGALFGQFRSYPLLAIEKQTGRHLFAGDTETAMIFMYGMGWSTVASLAKTYTNATGRSDKKAYLKKMLSPESLATQSLNYASVFSLFGDAVGGIGALTGITPGNSRGSNVIVPPVLSGLQRAMRGTNNIGGAMLFSDKDITEAGVRNVMSAIPLNNIPPMTLLTNQAAKLFSEE